MRLPLTLLLLAVGCHPTDDPLLPWPGPDAVPTTQPVRTAPGHRIEPVLTLLNAPRAVTLDPAGNLYVGEDGRPGDPAAPPRILRVSPAGHVDVLTEKLAAPIRRLKWHGGKLVVWHDGQVTCLGGDGESCPPPHGYEIASEPAAFHIADDQHSAPLVRRTADHAVFFAPADGHGRHKPVALALSADGKALYIADDLLPGTPDAGILWRITREGERCDGPPAGLSPPQQVGAPPPTTRSALNRG